jgi:hypothetical protein
LYSVFCCFLIFFDKNLFLCFQGFFSALLSDFVAGIDVSQDAWEFADDEEKTIDQVVNEKNRDKNTKPKIRVKVIPGRFTIFIVLLSKLNF